MPIVLPHGHYLTLLSLSTVHSLSLALSHWLSLLPLAFLRHAIPRTQYTTLSLTTPRDTSPLRHVRCVHHTCFRRVYFRC